MTRELPLLRPPGPPLDDTAADWVDLAEPLRAVATGFIITGVYTVSYLLALANGVTPGALATILGVQPVLTRTVAVTDWPGFKSELHVNTSRPSWVPRPNARSGPSPLTSSRTTFDPFGK